VTARYRARAKIKVTLTLIPSLVTCVIAVRPSGVAGKLHQAEEEVINLPDRHRDPG
jgi:hypothetical protein